MKPIDALREHCSRGGVTLRMREGKIAQMGVHHTLWYLAPGGRIHRNTVRRWVREGWVLGPKQCVRTADAAFRRYPLTDLGREALEAGA